MKAFQDYYPENLSHCYGCGRLNAWTPDQDLLGW